MRPALLVLLIAAFPAAASAQGMREQVPAGITVSGSATIKTPPDRATISFALRVEAATLAAAMADARTQAQALAAASGAHLGPIVSVVGSPDGMMSPAIGVTQSSEPVLAAYMAPPVKIDVSPRPVETTARVMVVYSLTN